MNTVQTHHKVFPILGKASASSPSKNGTTALHTRICSYKMKHLSRLQKHYTVRTASMFFICFTRSVISSFLKLTTSMTCQIVTLLLHKNNEQCPKRASGSTWLLKSGLCSAGATLYQKWSESRNKGTFHNNSGVVSAFSSQDSCSQQCH